MSKPKTNPAKILAIAKRLAKKSGHFPTMQTLKSAGVFREVVRQGFGSYGGLEQALYKAHPEIFSLAPVQSLVTSAHRRAVGAVKTHKTFFVTTAVVGCSANLDMLQAMETFCNARNAEPLVLITADPASRQSPGGRGYVDTELTAYSVVTQALRINRNLSISDIQLSAKQIEPVLGLDRFVKQASSMIFASPKQRLRYVPTSPGKLPSALMGTGACTIPNYRPRTFTEARTAFMAAHDHVMGGVIVEVENDQIFHFRQVQFIGSGFADLGKWYDGDGHITEYRPAAAVLGDLHAGVTDAGARKFAYELFDLTNPVDIAIHDAFNGSPVNHHNKGKLTTRSAISATIQSEVGRLAAELDGFALRGKISLIDSNHNRWLREYLDRGDYVHDRENYRYAIQLVQAMHEGKDPLDWAIRQVAPKLKFRSLSGTDSWIVGKHELAVHGHAGPNGRRGASQQELERSYGRCVTGHVHTPGIFRGVKQVGTMSPLYDPAWMQGASSWMCTHALVYPNGGYQLINKIGDTWRLG
mgnify:CR=1 FL=1